MQQRLYIVQDLEVFEVSETVKNLEALDVPEL